jgi:hypothetical protein
VADSVTSPLFVVEFDGAGHRSPVQAARDIKKDALCRKFSLPILRINSKYLAPAYRGMELLTWFAECFVTNRAFVEAEEEGSISPEDGFDLRNILSIGDRKNWPLDLSHDVRENFRRLREEGRIFDEQPSYIIGRDKEGTYRAFAFIAITKEQGVFAKTAMRAQQFEIDQADALEILINFEIDGAIKKGLTDASRLEPLTTMMRRMESLAGQIQPSREASMNGDWTTRWMFGAKR